MDVPSIADVRKLKEVIRFKSTFLIEYSPNIHKKDQHAANRPGRRISEVSSAFAHMGRSPDHAQPSSTYIGHSQEFQSPHSSP